MTSKEHQHLYEDMLQGKENVESNLQSVLVEGTTYHREYCRRRLIVSLRASSNRGRDHPGRHHGRVASHRVAEEHVLLCPVKALDGVDLKVWKLIRSLVWCCTACRETLATTRCRRE